MRYGRALLFCAMGAGGLLLVLLVVLPAVLGSAPVQAQLEALLERQLNRSVSIAGGMEVHVAPTVGVVFRNVSIAGEQGQPPLLRCQTLDLHLRAAALLRAELELSGLEAHGADLRMRLDDQEDATAQPGFNPALQRFDFVRLSSGALQVLDETGQELVSLRDINADYRREESGREAVTVSCSLPLPGVNGVEVDLSLEGELALGGRRLRQVELTNGTMEAVFEAHRHTGEPLRGRLTSALEGGGEAASLFARNALFRLGNMEVRGDLSLLSLYDSPRFRVEADVHLSDVAKACVALNLPVPKGARGNDAVPARLSGRCVADSDGVDCTGLELGFSDNQVRGEFSLTDYDDPAYKVVARSEHVDFSDFLPAGMLDSELDQGLEISLEEMHGEEEHPLEWFLDLEALVDVQIDRFQVGDVTGSTFLVDVHLDDGEVLRGRAGADFANGGFTASLNSTLRQGSLDLGGELVLRGRPEGAGGDVPLRRVLGQELHLKGRPGDFSGSLRLHPFNLHDVLWTMGVSMPDWAARRAFRRVQAGVEFSGGEKLLRISHALVEADGSRLQLSGILQEGQKPDVSCDVELENVDLDRVLRLKQRGTDELAGHPFALWDARLAPRMDWLHEFLLELRLKVRDVKLRTERLRELQAEASVSEGRVMLRSLQAKALGGSLEAQGALRLDGSDLRLRGEVSATAIRSGGKVFRGADDGMPAVADCTVHFDGSGASLQDIFTTLRGQVQARSRALVIQNWDDPVFHARGAQLNLHFSPAKSIVGDGYAHRIEGTLDLRRASFFEVRTNNSHMAVGGDIHWEKDLQPVFVLDGSLDWKGELQGAQGKGSFHLVSEGLMNMRQRAFRLEKASLVLPGGRFGGDLELEQRGGAWQLGGRLEAEQADPRKMCSFWGMKLYSTTDETALTRLQGSLRLRAGMGRVEASNLGLQLDGAQWKGRAALDIGQRYELDAYLSGKTLNIDRYLPGSGQTASAEGRVPVRLVRKLDLTGMVTLEKLIVGGMRAQGIRAVLNGRDGKWHTTVQAAAYDGSLSATMDLVAARRSLSAALEADISGLRMGPMLRHATDKEDGLSGTLSGSTALECRGSLWRRLLSTLSGSGRLHWTDAALGAGVVKQTDDGSTRISGSRRYGTDLGKGRLTFTVQQGVMRTKNLVSRSRSMNVNGGGEVDFPGRQVDISLTAETLGVASVPISITGPFGAVDVSVSGVGAVVNTAKEIVKVPLKPFEFLGRMLFGGEKNDGQPATE